jgi:hypothetical protein
MLRGAELEERSRKTESVEQLEVGGEEGRQTRRGPRSAMRQEQEARVEAEEIEGEEGPFRA